MIYAYNDPKGWGELTGLRLFKKASKVPLGSAAFVRLDQEGDRREHGKRMIAELNQRGIKTLPTAQEAIWYDDKAAQLPVLSRWMPATTYHTTPPELPIEYPFISKAIDGSSSKSVRIIHTAEAAEKEIETAFTVGMPSVYDRVQKNYLYWQEFIGGNDRDYRVVVTGDLVFGLVRLNKSGTPFASGSGKNYPLTMSTERERAAARLAVVISESIGTDWMAYDFVFRGDRPLVLEMSSAWSAASYETCPKFTRTLAPTWGSEWEQAKKLCAKMLHSQNKEARK